MAIKESRGARPIMAVFLAVGALLLCSAVATGIYFASAADIGVPKVARIVIPCALIFFGATFALVGGVLLFKEYKKRERARAARKNGCPVPCLVTAVYPDMSLIVNGKFPCNLLECSPLGGGAVYVSAPFSAKERVELLSGITVYADDDGGYFVDLGSIKPPASGFGKAAGTEQG